MSSFSWSSKNKAYKNGHYGSNHYQRRGIFGNLLNIFGSGSFSGYHQNYPGNYPNHPNWQGSNQVVMCPNCNGQIPAGSKFCAHCGEKMAELLFCNSCGEKLLPNAKFCAKCGTQANG
jgi:ribosomal protein L40E